MKKLIFGVIFYALIMPAIAQEVDSRVYETRSRITESMVQVKDQVGDFTITDSDGITWNLYDLLDEGKTVFLDLFFTT